VAHDCQTFSDYLFLCPCIRLIDSELPFYVLPRSLTELCTESDCLIYSFLLDVKPIKISSPPLFLDLSPEHYSPDPSLKPSRNESIRKMMPRMACYRPGGQVFLLMEGFIGMGIVFPPPPH